MTYEYTNLMRANLEETAAAIQLSPGTSLLNALRELKKIRSRSIFPVRFQLLQFMEGQNHVEETEITYTLMGDVSGKQYVIPRLGGLGSIDELPQKTLRACADWLAERAVSLDREGSRDISYYTRVFRALLEKNCWVRYRESDQRYLNRGLTRQYAYEMGHYLGFDLERMQGFISRVLPDEIYINKDAADLVEAYAFANGKTAADVQRMMRTYNDLQIGETVYDYIDIGNTHQLYEEAATFDGSEDEFIEWLSERRPVLEGRSRTAFGVYQNLVICAYLMMRALYGVSTVKGDDPIGELWECCIENGMDMLEYYNQHHLSYHLPEYDRLDWKKVGSEFNEVSEWAPSEKRERRYPRDFLIYLSIDKDGNFTTENTYSRILQIMKNGKAVQKRDVLCLIWQIYTFAWEYVAPEDISGQLRDFIDLATGILEQCNFTFYLPNLLEYSICRSLIVGGDMEDAYRSIITQGADSPLCENLCIRNGKSNQCYGVRFYACEEYTYDEIEKVLYAVSKGEKINVYNDDWKNIELWMAKADQHLHCGWDRIEDEAVIQQLIQLNRVVAFPCE